MLDATAGRLLRVMVIAPPHPSVAWTKARSVRASAPRHLAAQSGLLRSFLAWRRALSTWRSCPVAPDISDLKTSIEAVKAKLDALATDRDARIRGCAVPLPEDEQRVQYLAQFRIEDAKLFNIGPARCAVLRSWGIDTAADVDEAKIADIPGFGKGLTDKLILWREHQERGFKANTAAVVDPLDVQRIDRDLASRRTKLMKELREYVLALERRMADFTAAREELMRNLAQH
jgi:hypothetical protein